MVIRYPKGRILWKDVVVAEWDEGSGKMKLFGKVAEWESEYKQLMGSE